MQLPYLYLRSSDDVHDPHPFNFYLFGCDLHPLTLLQPNQPFIGNIETVYLFRRVSTICKFFNLNPFCKENLPSSALKAEQIGAIINEYVSPTNDGPIPEVIVTPDVNYLKKAVDEFETILGDEIGKLPIFCLEDEKIGNFSIKKLLNGASNGYPKKTSDRLTPLCKSEVDEAGKCLVYERHTAAGFHILRSVELTIRQYLQAVPGFVMPPLNRQNWGEYLKLLSDNGATRDVTDHLHNIKINYRNPLMHPEDTLEPEDAVGLFAVAQSMNEMLIKDLLSRNLIP